MRHLLFIIFLYSSSLFAQNYYPLVKTNFNTFIENPKIEWAIYHNDTLQTNQPDLREMLLTKMKEKKIKIFASEISGNISENNISSKSPYYDLKNTDHHQNILTYDSLGNEMPSTIQLANDDGPLGIVNLNQILYVENGKLLSYVSRVSPLKNIVTPSGSFLGRSEYFSTALNINPSIKKSRKDKIIFLKTTTTTITVDSIEKNDRLKETFGRNLIETLWPYIVSNKIALFNVAEDKPTTLKQINNFNLLKFETVAVPVYDSLGNLFGTKLISEEVTANSFNKISITQQWYYNDTKNIVYCIIPEAFLFLKKQDNEASNKNSKAALKINF